MNRQRFENCAVFSTFWGDMTHFDADRAAGVELTTMNGRCDVCGGVIGRANKSGVCSRTAECRLEVSRRWKAVHPVVHDDAYREWWRTYYAEHREARNAANKRSGCLRRERRLESQRSDPP